MGISESSFIRACYGKNHDGPIPIWIMRQAGRYLPEYQEVRQRVSFQELCRSPELIAEVVRQPVERFNLDAAILFSDILTILEPMGAEVSFPDGGPQIANPIGTAEDVNRLADVDPKADLAFVLEGIGKIKELLPSTPLIGFAGSPFTLSCYLIEGKGSKTFDKVKIFMHQHTEAGERLLNLLADNVGDYLLAQVEAGADAIQIFDSWGGILAHDDYERFSARPINRILEKLRDAKVPRIVFVNNVAPYFDLVAEFNCEVIGVDYRVNLETAALALPRKAIQGNLDPTILFDKPEVVAKETRRLLDRLHRHDNLVFNLGHGILPKTPIESVATMIKTVRGFRK
jgi:uroporphyrinogen decarboxylase